MDSNPTTWMFNPKLQHLCTNAWKTLTTNANTHFAGFERHKRYFETSPPLNPPPLLHIPLSLSLSLVSLTLFIVSPSKENILSLPPPCPSPSTSPPTTLLRLHTRFYVQGPFQTVPLRLYRQSYIFSKASSDRHSPKGFFPWCQVVFKSVLSLWNLEATRRRRRRRRRRKNVIVTFDDVVFVWRFQQRNSDSILTWNFEWER